MAYCSRLACLEDRHYVSVVEILLRSKGRRNFTYLVSLWGNEATIIISPISKIEAVGRAGHNHRFLLFVFTCVHDALKHKQAALTFYML